MSTEQAPVDLAALGLVGSPEEQGQEPELSSDEQKAVELMESINRSIEHLHLELRQTKARVSTLETFVSYLLDQDPGVKARMKAVAEAAEKAQQNEQKPE